MTRAKKPARRSAPPSVLRTRKVRTKKAPKVVWMLVINGRATSGTCAKKSEALKLADGCNNPEIGGRYIVHKYVLAGGPYNE